MAFCSYHPTKPARFHCTKCGSHYCQECISERARGTIGALQTQKLYFCPKCNIEAKSLGVGSFIEPFWRRLPKFFMYPLQPGPLVLMLILAAVSTFLGWVPFMGLVLWVVLVKYSYATLRNTMEGVLRPPDISVEIIGQDIGEAFKQIALFVLVAVSTALVFAKLGPVPGFFYLLFVILLLPSMIIVLVIGGSLVAALNPAAFVTVAFRIGWGYFLMYLFLVMLMGAPAALAQPLMAVLPQQVWQFLLNMAGYYYTIVAYNLMGYVVLQYHQELGYEVQAHDFRDQKAVMKESLLTPFQEDEEKPDPTQELLNQINILIQDGRPDDAVVLLRSRTRGPINDRALAERYYNLLKITQRMPEMLLHAISFLDLLASGNESKLACEVYRDCVALDAQFTPGPETLYRIADWSIQDGDVKDGVAAFIKFINANPEHKLAPKAHMVVARMLHEKLAQPDKAQQVLTRLVRKYPDHELAAHARRFLEQLPKKEARDQD
jgi:tetratricopeptide (TPR) repeat protein